MHGLKAVATSVLVLAGLCACGGGSGDAVSDAGLRSFASGMAEAGSRQAAAPESRVHTLAVQGLPVEVTADDWFDWIETSYPDVFPRGAQTQAVLFNHRNYLIRYYPQHNVYLGVTDDGHVHAMGAFTNQVPQQFGQLVNYRCVIDPGRCEGADAARISVWAWPGTLQCRPNEFPARLEALRQQLTERSFTVSGGQCAWTLEYAVAGACGMPDGRMAVLTVPLSEFPRALGEGWRPFRDGVNGNLNHPFLSPCDGWSSVP